MSKFYALEYLNEDAELCLRIFNAEGKVELDYIARGTFGDADYHEPEYNQFLVCETTMEPTEDKLAGGTGFWFTQIGTITTDDDMHAYEKLEDLDLKKMFELCESQDIDVTEVPEK